MQVVKLSDLLKKYEDKWVALNKARTEVLAFGQTLEEALLHAQGKSSENPIMTYVPRLDLDYVG